MNEQELQKIIKAADNLDPLPSTAIELTRLVGDPQYSMNAVVQLMSKDAALTARLMRVANSVLYGGQRPVRDVAEAVVRVGSGVVASMAMGVAIRGRLSGAAPAYGYGEGELWKHSVATSLAAECLPRFTKTIVPREAITAGLLHDIGKLALSRFLDKPTLARLSEAQRDGTDSSSAEWKTLATDHSAIGGMMAENWRLPRGIRLAVAHHHNPEEVELPTSDVVHVANAVAGTIGVGKGAAEPNPDVLKRLRLHPEAWDSLCALTNNSLEEVMQRYTD